MATSFMDNIRRPKSLGRWAPTGEILAGESDPYAWGKDLIERDFRNSQVDEMPGFRRGNISRMGSSVANPNFNRAGFDPAKVYQNTVYNQGPEMATKQLNLQKDKMAAAEKENEKQRVVDMMAANDEFIDKRRATELKQKQIETQDWAARNLKPGELGDREKLEIQNKNRMSEIASQGDIQKAVAAVNNAARDRGSDARIKAAEIAAGAKTQPAANTDPKDVAQTIQNKLAQLFLDPEFAQAIEQTDKGFAINSGIDEDLRRRLSNRLYARTGDINLAGVGSAGLGGNPAAGIPITGNGQNPAVTNNATPSVGNASPNTQGQLMRKTQKNAKTGATRVLVSRDGGATWQPE